MEVDQNGAQHEGGPAPRCVAGSGHGTTELVPQFLGVVEVDGSEKRERTLCCAANQATLPIGGLRNVIASCVHVGNGLSPTFLGSCEELARRALDATMIAPLGRAPVRPVRVGLKQRHPRQVRVDASADADLLVVGSRDRGGLEGVLLDSVGEHCAPRKVDCGDRALDARERGLKQSSQTRSS